jgi:hypothetical protein
VTRSFSLSAQKVVEVILRQRDGAQPLRIAREFTMLTRGAFDVDERVPAM